MPQTVGIVLKKIELQRLDLQLAVDVEFEGQKSRVAGRKCTSEQLRRIAEDFLGSFVVLILTRRSGDSERLANERAYPGIVESLERRDAYAFYHAVLKSRDEASIKGSQAPKHTFTGH